ncbi:MAG: hypothetical protein IJM88_04085 [Bacteroidales bacterium]|nr:hypothetical protein [Bacteroidales bacterium]
MNKRIALLLVLCLLGGCLCAQTKTERKKNLVVKELNYKSKTAAPLLDHQTTYDALGRKIEEVEYNTSQKQKTREVYEYEGNAKKPKREIDYNDKNKVVCIKVFEYDEQGQKTKQYKYDAHGTLLGTKVYEYSYK